MRLVVCGCSWSSECHQYPNTGYGSYLAEYLQAEYINLARSSASNYVIRTQIDYACEHLNPDLVVVSWTTPERFTWKFRDQDSYMPETALQQITYYDTPERTNSFHPVPGMEPCVASESWSHLFGVYDHNIDSILNADLPNADIGKNILTADQFDVLKKYFLHFVDTDLLKHEQYYLVESAVAQLQRTGVKFLMARAWTAEVGAYHDWNCIPTENFVDSHPREYLNISRGKQHTVHHLHPRDQHRFVVKELLPKATALLK